MSTTSVQTGTLHVMGANGDTRTVWDADDPNSVEVARAAFDAAKEKGFLAYTVEDGEKGEAIKEFDPQAGAIIMTPQLVGG